MLLTADDFPQARKRMEEFVETFNRTSNQTIDLFEKTLGVYQATSVPDAQRRVQDVIDVVERGRGEKIRFVHHEALRFRSTNCRINGVRISCMAKSSLPPGITIEFLRDMKLWEIIDSR